MTALYEFSVVDPSWPRKPAPRNAAAMRLDELAAFAAAARLG